MKNIVQLGRPLRRSLTSVACLAAVSALALGMSGCTNMSGLGGSSEMTCAAPPGVPCQSVSGAYANATAGNLPSRRLGAAAVPSSPAPQQATASNQARFTPLLASDEDGTTLGAIRSDPTLIRVWIAPWEDSDGDLHSDSYVYLQVDSGRWLIEHNRERVRKQFAPMPTTATTPSAAPAGAAAAGTAAKPTPQYSPPQRTSAAQPQGASR
jgi:conjugal transfer pilus assembly protein TraV